MRDFLAGIASLGHPAHGDTQLHTQLADHILTHPKPAQMRITLALWHVQVKRPDSCSPSTPLQHLVASLQAAQPQMALQRSPRTPQRLPPRNPSSARPLQAWARRPLSSTTRPQQVWLHEQLSFSALHAHRQHYALVSALKQPPGTSTAPYLNSLSGM